MFVTTNVKSGEVVWALAVEQELRTPARGARELIELLQELRVVLPGCVLSLSADGSVLRG